jgi:tripeptidyl-peptidase-1
MGLWKLALLNVLSATAALASQVADHVLHEKRDASSDHHWVKRDRLSPTDPLPMRIGLAQRNLHLGHDLLMDVADPTSPNYGKHWTREQVLDTFGPSHESISAVKDWLGRAGITEDRIEHSVSRGWVTFEATAGEAEQLLHTEYYRFDHKLHGRSSVGCDEYDFL